MIHEVQVQFTKIDNKGNDKVVKEKYLVGIAESFGDAETQAFEYCNGETALDVVAIKRSKVKEIINSRSNDNDVIFIADVASKQVNEDGEEVEFVYKWALFAFDFDDAYRKVNEYLKQGYDMSCVGMKKTKFLDVIK